MVKNIARAGIIILIMLLLYPSQVLAIGIGIAPSELKITNALQGGEYDRTITLFNPDASMNNFTLRVEGEASGWISFHSLDGSTEIKEISIGSKGNYPFLVNVKVPEDSAIGSYNATVYAETLLGTKTMEGVGTVVQASAIVTIEVTGEQIMDGVVDAVLIEDTELGYPLRITTIFRNTGNVVANPKIAVTILQDENIVENFTHERTKVKPTSNEHIIAEWNTTSKNIPGDYNASVVVSLDGRTLKSEEVPFKILPVGTLSRQGNLTDIIIEGEIVVDTIIKVKSYFKNTGQIDTPAKFSAEVYKDNKLTDTLSSDELTVQKNKEMALISYLKLTSPGDYLIKGKVIYSGKETPVKEYSFKVPKSAPGFDALYAVFVIIIFSMIKRRNRGGIK
jgi:hypothetical protein